MDQTPACTKYPVLMLHGVGFRDLKWPLYWGRTRRGLSHLDEIDFRQAPLTRKAGEGVADICDVYRQIITNLAARGF